MKAINCSTFRKEIKPYKSLYYYRYNYKNKFNGFESLLINKKVELYNKNKIIINHNKSVDCKDIEERKKRIESKIDNISKHSNEAFNKEDISINKKAKTRNITFEIKNIKYTKKEKKNNLIYDNIVFFIDYKKDLDKRYIEIKNEEEQRRQRIEKLIKWNKEEDKKNNEKEKKMKEEYNNIFIDSIKKDKKENSKNNLKQLYKIKIKKENDLKFIEKMISKINNNIINDVYDNRDDALSNYIQNKNYKNLKYTKFENCGLKILCKNCFYILDYIKKFKNPKGYLKRTITMKIRNKINKINNFKKVNIITKKHILEKNKFVIEESKCCICLEKFDKKDTIIFLPCLHIFHNICIFKWIEKSFRCPLCKYNMSLIFI